MIVSHKHKFIFSKPRKVAGTSVQVALAKHCGPDDIITPEISYSEEVDGDSQYVDQSRNDKGFFNHMKPARIRAKVGNDVWNEYFKFTIVRNPWDVVVSRYFWNKKNVTPRKSPAEVVKEILQEPLNVDLYGKWFFAMKRELTTGDIRPDATFEEFLEKLPHNVSNEAYYFDKNGEQWNDFVIRYEHLDKDYKTVCEKIGIPYEELLGLKGSIRKKRDYRDMYTQQTRELIAKKFAKEIDFFGYTFD